jgi:signal transduction histidine kinase
MHRRRAVTTPVLILGVTALYVMAGMLGLRLTFLHPHVTAVRPAIGTALAACLLLGARVWPGVFLGTFLVRILTLGAVAPALGIACGNTLTVLLGAHLVRRWANGCHAFDRASDIFRFTVFAGLLSPILSATLGIANLTVGGFAHWVDSGALWWTWWLGDAMGVILVTPLVLSWSKTPCWPWRCRMSVEAVLVCGATVLVGLLVFSGLLPGDVAKPLAFFELPLLAWMAFHLNQRAVTTTVAVLAILATWGRVQGWGPFAHETPNAALLLLYTFMGVMAITTTAVVAVVAELKQTKEAVMRLNQELEVRVQARTAALHEAMTERQRLAREAQHAQHFAVLGRLAAGVSHDIRNPLAALTLHVDLLEEELREPSPDSAPEMATALSEIKLQLERLEDLVEDYLSLARVVHLERTPQDLGTAVHAWATEMQRAAAARGVAIHLEGLERVGQVAFHPSSLRRVVVNLMQNALEAMEHGGTLMLAGQGSAREVRIEVRDTGHGIGAGCLQQIFEPLYTTKPKGTGLGLYIAQEIVRAHGGQLTVQSTEGQGTTFIMTLSRDVAEVPNCITSPTMSCRKTDRPHYKTESF